MYIPIDTQTAVLAASTAITLSPTSVTTEPARPTDSGPVRTTPRFSCGATAPASLYTRPTALPGHPPAVPDIFTPALEDDEFYHVGDDKVDRCLREAIKLAGRDRYKELTGGGKSTSWTDFLTKSRDDGLVGSDTNKDGNSVLGLAEHVKSLAEDNPKFDLGTEDIASCQTFVRQFTSHELLDELILSWANNFGHLDDLPPTRPQVKKGPVKANVTSDYDIYSTILPGDGAVPVVPPSSQTTEVIGQIFVDDFEGFPHVIPIETIREVGKPPHSPRSAAVSGSSTRSLHHGRVSLNEHGLPANITIPDLNFTIPFKWKVHGNLTSGNSSTLSRRTHIANSTPPVQVLPPIPVPVRIPEGFLPENTTLVSHSTEPVDSPGLEDLADAQLIRGETGPFNSSRLDAVASTLVPDNTGTTRLDDPPKWVFPNKTTPLGVPA